MKGSALVTGGVKRIGKEIVKKLASEGYNIALNCNSSINQAKVLSSEVEKMNVKCEIFQCDLNVEESIASLIPLVINKLPDLNLLINNASVFQRASLTSTDFKLFNQNMNINFKAPYFLTRDFATHCKKGHIINMIDSKVAHNDLLYSAYTLSKKALADFTKMAAKELAPNIRVNAIAPGYILPPEDGINQNLKQRLDNIPLKRKGTTSEITESIHFLIQNQFITGQILFIDGGEHL